MTLELALISERDGLVFASKCCCFSLKQVGFYNLLTIAVLFLDLYF